MALDTSRIKRSLGLLRAAHAPVLGAASHQFLLNPTLGDAEVQSFERQHRLKLPAEYRHFVTTVGNGGAGPFYGVFPVGTIDGPFGFQPWPEEDGIVGRLAEPFPLEAEWNDLRENPGDGSLDSNDPEFETKLEQFEARYWDSSIVNGAIPICHAGCAIRIWLVITGNQRGRLWLDGRAEFSGLSPLYSNGRPATFDSWYEEWLESALREGQLGR